MIRLTSTLLLLLAAAPLAAGELTIASLSPTPRSMAATVGSVVTVTFDRPIDRSTVIPRRSFWAFGRWSGAADGTISYADGDRTMVLQPSRPFSAGESVMVFLSNELRGADASSLRSSGYSFQFMVRSEPSGLDFTETDRFSTRTTPGVTSRAYGGVATDFDADGYLDITIVNEDTDDLRVFRNRADGSATFESMLTPTGVGNVPSPSEPSDFNADGHADLCVANTQGGSVSIVLGRGDGTFDPHQEIDTGGDARGIAVLDADGDGDVDIAVTDVDNSRLALLLNDGQGVFAAPSFFGSGTHGEWALASGDMNHDGLLDLVAGGRATEVIDIYTGNGDGTFDLASSQPAGGAVWMLVLGDLDGDGDEDVAAANSFDNHGAILLGDGAGNLGAAVTHGTDPLPLASDLGDLDGDGDLDWVTASFNGDWSLFVNDGNGVFTFEREFDATNAASCSLAFDADRDGDLDLALIDELADEVIVLTHPGNPSLVFRDDFESGDTSAW